jgi:uncharacterized spore protein YtfJ
MTTQAITKEEFPANDNLVQSIAEKLGIAAKSIKIYDEPIERGGTTIIPVSKISYGFGGGSRKQKEQKGSGGGGGLTTSPVGYIEIKNGQAKFRQIIDLPILIPLITAGSLALLTVFWGVGKLLQISKKEAQ